MIPTRAKRRLTLIALLFISCFSHTSAQQNTESRVFNVSVVDVKGRPYPGLNAEDFAAWVNKKPRKILSVSAESAPVSAGLLIDNSGSMPASSKKAGEEFAQRLHDELVRLLQISNSENDYFISQFDKKVAQTERWSGADTSVLSELRALGNFNGTALYDALYLGIQNVMNGRHSKRVILIISDGQDNGSKRTQHEVVELIKKSDVTIYAIAIRYREEKNQFVAEEGVDVLEKLAKVSGGRAMSLSSMSKPEVITEAFDIIAANLRHRYRLSVESDNVAGPEKWHKVKVKLNLPKEKGQPALYVQSRQGYYQ